LLAPSQLILYVCTGGSGKNTTARHPNTTHRDDPGRPGHQCATPSSADSVRVWG